MNRKRLLFLHNEFPDGGAERVTIDIAHYVSSYGYETYVLAKKIRTSSIPLITMLPLPDTQELNSKKNADAIVRVLNDWNIDIFVLPVQTLSYLAQIRERVRCRIVFALHSVPFWEIQHNLYAKRKQCRHSFFKRIKWLFLLYPKTNWLKHYHKRVMGEYERIYRQVDAYTVLCDGYKQELIKKMKLASGENKLRVIPNAEKEIEVINLQKKKQVLFVGRMSYEDKRVDRLLDIWEMIYKQIPEWELVLVGDGEEKISLEQSAVQKKLQRIRFVGHSDCVQAYYRESALLCLTSTFEGWPLCLTEAQANGVIPIAFDCAAGVHEILAPSGVNGFLIPPLQKKMFANVLLKLLQDPDRIKQMQRHVILKSMSYAPDVIGDKWLTLFESLLSPNIKQTHC
ncbi:MAG: glycosyltransferase [Bacteroides sp.]